MTYRCISAWDFQIGVGKADIPITTPLDRFLSLHCTSKPFHTQVDSLSDEGNSEYTCTLPVSFLNDLCLDLCPCIIAWVRCCDIAHWLKYCTSQCREKSHALNLIGSSGFWTVEAAKPSNGSKRARPISLLEGGVWERDYYQLHIHHSYYSLIPSP